MSLLTAARIEELAMEFWDDAHDPTFRPILLGCQATLKKLTLRVYTDGESIADAGRLGSLTTTSPVRLEALREFDYVNTDEVANKIRLISCPNIESLTITHSRTTHCMIPPWPTTKLSELVLNVNRDSAIPQFSKSIRPSYLTIRIRKEALQPYRSATDWIKDCMDRLPFPNHLRHLNICIITSHHRRQERFAFDYYDKGMRLGVPVQGPIEVLLSPFPEIDACSQCQVKYGAAYAKGPVSSRIVDATLERSEAYNK
ncbi:hypothetical protein AB1N83_011755 [Pleurotus pulmonarius]